MPLESKKKKNDQKDIKFNYTRIWLELKKNLTLLYRTRSSCEDFIIYAKVWEALNKDIDISEEWEKIVKFATGIQTRMTGVRDIKNIPKYSHLLTIVQTWRQNGGTISERLQKAAK